MTTVAMAPGFEATVAIICLVVGCRIAGPFVRLSFCGGCHMWDTLELMSRFVEP